MTDNNATIKMFTIANASCKQKQNIKIFIYNPITHVRKWRIIKAQEESHQILFFFFGIEKEKKKGLLQNYHQSYIPRAKNDRWERLGDQAGQGSRSHTLKGLQQQAKEFSLYAGGGRLGENIGKIYKQLMTLNTSSKQLTQKKGRKLKHFSKEDIQMAHEKMFNITNY